ncbi:hypothetical protein AWRI1631_121730 [Saccharomyces cerevisiae AWRI1631]|uniref:L3118 protein n=2 Tax=Saccharomyces cerevisiae TaxID=4932 RepID=V9H0W3_YEASX|nr:hypothetical protein AWRI1631_121730 [Saccharomyces cerevisiae AWRI1631]CAA62641.1 L3118 [Saccharomyces cerevisiae]
MARYLSSGETRTHKMSSVNSKVVSWCSFKTGRNLFLVPGTRLFSTLKSQNLTVLSADPVTNRLPSEVRSSDQIAASCASSMVSKRLDDARSKSCNSPFLVPSMTSSPPGKNLQVNAYPHSKVLIHLCVLIFHIFNEPLDAVASNLLSSLMSILRTSVLCPCNSIVCVLRGAGLVGSLFSYGME